MPWDQQGRCSITTQMMFLQTFCPPLVAIHSWAVLFLFFLLLYYHLQRRIQLKLCAEALILGRRGILVLILHQLLSNWGFQVFLPSDCLWHLQPLHCLAFTHISGQTRGVMIVFYIACYICLLDIIWLLGTCHVLLLLVMLVTCKVFGKRAVQRSLVRKLGAHLQYKETSLALVIFP